MKIGKFLGLVSVLMIANATFAADLNPDSLSHRDIPLLTDQELSGYVTRLSAVVSEIEKKSLSVPADSDGLRCTQAGWFFTSKGSCLSTLGQTGCETGKLRCASWTGAKQCVAKSGSPLAACLASVKTEKFGLFYRSPLASGDWQIIHTYVEEACKANKRKTSCAEFYRHRSATVKLVRGRSLKISKAPTTRKEAYISRRPWPLLELLFIERAEASQACSYSKEEEAFIKADGKRLFLHLARHQAGNQAGNGFIHDFLTANPNAGKKEIEDFLMRP